MNISQLIRKSRDALQDHATPNLVSDEELTELFNEAVDEACIRLELLFDATTTDVCNIAITAGLATYQTHAAIVCINHAYLVGADGKHTILDLYFRDSLDILEPGWRTSTGDPGKLIVDSGSVQIAAAPKQDGTLYLEVRRIPLETERIAYGGDPTSPSIPRDHHQYLHHYPLSVLYNRYEEQFFDPKSAARHDALFNWHFGDPISPKKVQESKLSRPQMGWLGCN